MVRATKVTAASKATAASKVTEKTTETVPDTRTTASGAQKRRPGRPPKKARPETQADAPADPQVSPAASPVAPTRKRQNKSSTKNQRAGKSPQPEPQTNAEEQQASRVELFEQTRNDQHDKVLESVMIKERAMKRSLARQAQETRLQLDAANSLNVEKETQLAAANARNEELEKELAELKRQMLRQQEPERYDRPLSTIKGSANAELQILHGEKRALASGRHV